MASSDLLVLMASVFGILGNIISFCVFLAPLPTFYKIYTRKSSEGFHSVPYSVALFSCMLLLYYGCLKNENGMMIITINSIGFVIETTYLGVFMIYATRESLISTIKLLVSFNILSYWLIVITTHLATNEGPQRAAIVGWICAVFSVSVFAAPLSVMRMVIRTRSVEYMPFMLSFFLTLCAIMWFFYGLLIKDYYIAAPNVLGFMFGVAQMILYVIYRPGRQVRPLDPPTVEPTMMVVNLEVILEVEENPVIETELISEEEEKTEAEIEVVLEKQENPITQAEVGNEYCGEKKECTTTMGVNLGGEMTIIPSTV